MLLLQSESADVTVVLLGRGLIGSAIERSLRTTSTWQQIHRYEFPWGQDASDLRRQQLSKVLQQLGSSVHIVWSAGRAGFSASEKETACELEIFEQVVSFAESANLLPSVAAHLHVLSSAGGLFEGLRGISEKTRPAPRRPYGDLKMAQEAAASSAETHSYTIYRPTSVYSTVQTGKRRGLIPTLIWNTLNNRTTSIYGNQDTLRDYVWADDVGRFVAGRILDDSPTESGRRYLLATAVPTSISRIIRLVENMMMRPAPIQLINAGDNTLDITVSPSGVPRNLNHTDLASAIRQIHMRLMSDGMIAHD